MREIENQINVLIKLGMVATVDKDGKPTPSFKTSSSQESTTSELSQETAGRTISEPSQETVGQLSEERVLETEECKKSSLLVITELGRATVKGE